MATKAEILAPLNEEQKEIAIHYNGKINVEAIPGSGKTFSIVATIAYMIKDGIKPSKILAFTFTKKAAKELKERVRNAVGPDADKILICTYHSFCARLLRSCCDYCGRTSQFSIYDEDDKKKVLNEIVKSYFKKVGVVTIKYPVVVNYISHFKIDNLSPTEAKISRSKTSYGKACAFIYEAYENKMRELNAFDYDDLPYFAYRITKNNPEVLDAVASRFDYIISDENQDSNRTNLDMLLLLGSKSHNIMMVGDTDQSIYGFRGADVKNVIDVIGSHGFQTKRLSTNYRSTETIVKAADGLIKNNKHRINKDSNTANEVGENIDCIYLENSIKESEYICKKIKILRSKTPDLKYSDIAILCRTQNQIDKLEERFLIEHIPFTCPGKVPFYCRAEIKDILAFVRFAVNERDIIALDRVINIPKRGIGETTLKNLISSLSDKPLCDIINDSQLLKKLKFTKKAQAGIKSFYEVIDYIRKSIDTNVHPEEILNNIQKMINYDDHLVATVKVSETLEEKRLNLKELIYLASTYDSVAEFLESAVVDEPVEENEKKDDKVNIMTMHSSKGLEFKIVIIAGAHDEAIPHIMCHQDKDSIEEERRLFYVSLTRAENKLIITIPKTVISNMGIQKAVSQSRFLTELPTQYVNKFRY